MKATHQRVILDGVPYHVEVIRRRRESPSAPRLITVCYNPTAIGVEVTRVGVESILRHTPGRYELWVVDNASPPELSAWLRSIEGVNVVLNHTPPVPPDKRGWRARLGLRRIRPQEQMSFGSYANAVGLELGAWAIEPDVEQVFVMHNDVLALRDNWLSYLQSKLSQQVRAASMVQDTAEGRIRALHVSGLLFDFTLFHELGMSFYPQPPRLDVGDRISAVLRAHGYGEFVCRNTFNEPELVEWIPEDDPLRRIHADRAFDDDRNVIFAHLGRGTPKATGHYKKPGKTYPEEWVRFAREVVLA